MIRVTVSITSKKVSAFIRAHAIPRLNNKSLPNHQTLWWDMVAAVVPIGVRRLGFTDTCSEAGRDFRDDNPPTVLAVFDLSDADGLCFLMAHGDHEYLTVKLSDPE